MTEQQHLLPDETRLLRRAGIFNPQRLPGLIRRTISFLGLDLSGLTVLTEAASGPYVVTPVVAAMAGAERVIALTRDSAYATAEEVVAQTRALEAVCGLRPRAEIHTRRSAASFAEADIVTNLGMVRPIDGEAVGWMKQSAVVPLMCEAWEFRPGDVDLEACRRKGIAVFGTNEDYPGLEVFSYSGWLCLKMLFEAEIEVHKSRIVVVSGDKFGGVIERQLTRSGADARLLPHLRGDAPALLESADALVVADYTRDDVIVGPGGDLSAEELARLVPGVAVIQFAGRVDAPGLAARGIAVHPGIELGARRMARTLAALGPRPVVELHAAGLKVGELAARNPAGASAPRAAHGLLQEVGPGGR